MLKIKKSVLSPRLTLTHAATDKFKTGVLSVNLVTRLSAEDASKNALIPMVLRRGTSTLPDMRSLSEAFDDLYGARIVPMVRKKGERQCIGFFADFADDDYIPGDEKVLERTTALLGEMLLRPATSGGRLVGEYVESERRNLVDSIRAEINNKRAYATSALLRSMCAEEAYGVNKLGDEKTAVAITAQSLTVQYKKLIETARVEVFYIGAATPERVETAVSAALSGLPKTKVDAVAETDVRLAPPTAEPRRFTESLDVTQGKLAMGFRIGEAMMAPDYAAIAVFNAIFGGCLTSKLFVNVREKLSLCYYASSAVEKHKGVMIVSSGVEFDNLERAREEILKNLDEIREGEVSDFELLSAKRAVATSLLAQLDDPRGLEEACFDQLMAEIPYTPDEFATLAEMVTREKVVEIANSVRLDSVYNMLGTGAAAEEVSE